MRRPLVPAGPGLNATELTVVLSKNANWVFDGIRRDMRHGKYADALRKLNNYLGDPLAPDADEATYLSALCLEQLGRVDAAQVSLAWTCSPLLKKSKKK